MLREQREGIGEWERGKKRNEVKRYRFEKR